MKKTENIITVLFFLLTTSLLGQTVEFQSSNLPIIVINTNGGTILDEPKITARMGIISNTQGNRNSINDTFNEYDGFIGIELRGKSSQSWDKKPYSIETRDSLGENLNVSIFGMPKENDWVLHAPYVDKTLMRNVLMYRLAAEMGWYAPRTQFCELILNDEYMGVYVFIEKIKRDKNRVNISKLDSTDITGGYLLEMIINSSLQDDETHFKLEQSLKEIVVKYPDTDKITPEQLTYISKYFNDFEATLNSELFIDSVNGYAKYIDIPSFVDHMLLSEAFNQLDAFSHSVYFYKDKNERLHLGPGWDYNRSMGNAKYYTSWRTDVWWLREPYGSNPELWYRINWPKRLMKDPTFMKAYSERWFELRQSIFNLDSLHKIIDGYAQLLDEAKERNFERWKVLGVNLNNKYTFDTFEEETDYMKEWITTKFTWLDEQFDQSENYALNNLFNYSSQEEGDVNPATNAVDGDESTRWSAQTFPQWIEIDLNEVRSINKTVIIPYSERAYQYTIETKIDSSDSYSLLVDRSNNNEGGTSISNSFNPISARYLKLNVTGAENYSGDWCSILEFKVFGNPLTNVEIKENEIPKTIILKQNYPNPFNPTTTINYSIQESGLVKLKVYNLLGQVVVELVNEFKTEGNYTNSFNASNLSTGAYFYKIQVGNYSAIRKMLLVK